jgi:hypothetical protein
MAFNEALALAVDLNIPRIHVASDCLEVINNLKNESPCKYGMILKEIAHKNTTLFQEVVFAHEHRVSNVDAHNLAKALSSLPEGRHIWLFEFS